MLNKWQTGELDTLYGPYDPKRKRPPPPLKEYVKVKWLS
jgi:hypothetical protein